MAFAEVGEVAPFESEPSEVEAVVVAVCTQGGSADLHTALAAEVAVDSRLVLEELEAEEQLAGTAAAIDLEVEDSAVAAHLVATDRVEVRMVVAVATVE